MSFSRVPSYRYPTSDDSNVANLENLVDNEVFTTVNVAVTGHESGARQPARAQQGEVAD
jgi:hypothetical protein